MAGECGRRRERRGGGGGGEHRLGDGGGEEERKSIEGREVGAVREGISREGRRLI